MTISALMCCLCWHVSDGHLCCGNACKYLFVALHVGMHVFLILNLGIPTQVAGNQSLLAHREVLEESRELRIVLCRPKISGSRTGSAVVAACGEHISHLLYARIASLVDTLCEQFAVHCAIAKARQSTPTILLHACAY